MSWWTTVEDGTKVIGNGVAWIWNHTPLSPTINYVIEEGLALRETIPAIVTPAVLKMLKGMGNVLFYDVLPVASVHLANNGIQRYFRTGYNTEQASMLAPYNLFLSSLSLVNYAVKIYTLRQASQLVVHTLILDSLGSSSFNAYKAKLTKPPETLCIEEECNFKRKFKGSLREPIVLAGNDLVLWGISKLPYGGEQLSWLLAIYFYGEYITRMATPERCERHKAMKSESVFSIGLLYTVSSALMDRVLESTVGMPPYLYLRTLRHLLLLTYINIASHLTLPLVKPQPNVVVQSAKPVKLLTTAPKPIGYVTKHTLPAILYLRFGLPIKLSEFLMSLSKKEDFWDFVDALEHWLERNNVSYNVKLSQTPVKSALHDEGKIIESPPEEKTKEPLAPPQELIAPSTTKVTDAKNLITKKNSPLINANRLFSTKQRVPLKDINIENPNNNEQPSLQYNRGG
ncbi:MAG: hypothetical protein HYX60_01835 [Legionella longbeachae]|nr:hypothetical protein [Legionella longbeachae]